MSNDKFIDGCVIAVFMIFVLFCLNFLFTSTAYAEDYSKAEKYMKTDVGYVVLSGAPCQIEWEQPGNGLDYHAYATDGPDVHIGCWKLADPVTVQVFWPEVGYSGVYKAELFKDEK